jgi:hypothetical protein
METSWNLRSSAVAFSHMFMEVADTFDRVDEIFLRTAIRGSKKDCLMNIKGIGGLSVHLELIRGLGRRE